MVKIHLTGSIAAAALLAIFSIGCSKPPSPQVAAPKPSVRKPPTKIAESKPRETESFKPAKPIKVTDEKPHGPNSLADLAAQAEAMKDDFVNPLRFKPPEVDEAKCAGRGIRKLVSKHLILYTDCPSSPAIDELPEIFDLAVPQWAEYFGIDPAKAEKWQMIAALANEKEKFYGTGLWPEDLPKFLHGYMLDAQFWLYEQPSDYYRRHLMLHEGTHAFMWAFLGGMGAPWYGEGSAELLGTHTWSDGKLTLNVVPPSRESSPMWGRIKVIRDDFAANTAMPLAGAVSIRRESYLHTESYAWSWGAAVFFDHDPQFREPFRRMKSRLGDISNNFTAEFLKSLPQPLEQVNEQWQYFVGSLDYGYDVARESIVRKPSVPLPDGGSELLVLADHGWQSSGFEVKAGTTYSITATGDFQVASTTKPWISQADGVTLRYYRSQPLGKLLAAVTDEGKSNRITPLLTPQAIGAAGEIKPDRDGVLYLRINDSPAELADNQGELKVVVSVKP